MGAIAVSKIRIDDAGRLHVIPASNPSKMFRFVYRAAMGVEWDEEEQGFYTPVPQELSYADWWSTVLAAVKSEMGVSLTLETSTVWENVSPSLQQIIRQRVAQDSSAGNNASE
jgi:hypothetical protein